MNKTSEKTDIMDQISSYSQKEIEKSYYEYKNEYESQLRLNKVLKEENYENNANEIKNFISRNSNEIDYQLERLRDLTVKLKLIIDENNNMKKEYEEIINSEECINTSQKLKELKDIKKRMDSFLSKAGI
tara:strand:+ start:22 stop:411 length:390 start_codon:yes stop_codon:yes gene_type:complete